MVLVGEVLGDTSAELVTTGMGGETAELVRQWLVACAGAPPDLRPPVEGENTYRSYRRTIGEWLAHCIARGIDPLAPARTDVDEWLNLLTHTPTRYGKTPTKATMASRASAVASFYSCLIEEDMLDSSPVRKRTRPRAGKHSTTVGLSAGEVDQFEQRLAQEPGLERAILLTLLWQGLRITELLTMTVDALGYDKGVRTMRVHGKGGKVRVIPVDPAAAAAIGELLTLRFGDEEPPGDALLFAPAVGVRPTRQAVTRDLRRIARAAGIPSHANLSPHSLRHSCATLMLDGGAPLHVVQAFLGHSSPETTVRYDLARGALERSTNAQSGMRDLVTANQRSHPPGGSR